MKKIGSILLVFLMLFSLTSCSKSAKDRDTDGLEIVTSFYPIYALTEIVSGDLNQVTMIQSDSGIHGFEPSATDVAAIYEADVFIYHSKTLESWAGALATNLEESDVHVVEAAADLEMDRVKGLEDVTPAKGQDEASLYDPHTWNDPLKAAEEAKLIAKALSKLDPKHAETYEANAARFEDEAKELVARYQPQFEEVDKKYFVTSHTAFSYLAKRFDLEQLGIAGISTEQEPTSRQLADIESFIQSYGIKTIFVEQGVSQKLAETVAQATGADLVELSPLERKPNTDQSYLSQLEENLEILLVALKGEPPLSPAGQSSSVENESKTMADINAQEGIDAEQVVIKITPDGYVTSHGDHFHYYSGQVPFDALLSEDLILSDSSYVFDSSHVVSDVLDGHIIKVNEDYFLYLKEGSEKKNIRSVKIE